MPKTVFNAVEDKILREEVGKPVFNMIAFLVNKNM